ncbi:MAG: O-antigen ligase family protein [Gammaproteobacteria bacterium]|nr:MAG: O-antigen ligase family protein [Gammaproteobacteria bacterium]
MLNYRNYSHLFLIILFLSFQAQQFSIPLDLTPIKPYMLLVIFALIVFLIKCLSKQKLFFKFIWIDYFFILFYGFMASCISRASNAQLAVHLLIGLCVLGCAYFVIRLSCYKLSVDALRDILVLVGKLFFYISFFWFIFGVVLHYGFNIALSIIDDDDAASYLYGLYMEGESIPRLRGICDSPNNFGMYAVIFAPIVLLCLKRVTVFFGFVLILSVALTLSATTYIAFGFMLLIWAFRKSFTMKAVTLTPNRLFKFSVFIIVVMALLISISNSPLIDQINDVIIARLEHAETGSGRWELWDYALNLISERPLLGYGLNQSRELLLPLRALKSTHNNILELLLEGGIGALFFYILLLGGCLVAIYKVKYRTQDRDWMYLAFAGTFVISNANVNLYNESFVLLLALIAGFVGKSSSVNYGEKLGKDKNRNS